MLMPSIFGENLFDNFFDYPFRSQAADTSGLMKTDIKDTDNGYEITMNLPGVKKEDVKAELKDGYMTISAVSNSSKDEKDEKGQYIRRERYSGSCSRSFYVGDGVTEADIKAKFEDGTLKLLVPKKEEKPAVENKKYIAIEG
ncbi:MAG: Hsp20/alpha crystallin family protein [Eubacteriales bacterium]|nr:Hsp20/alpha crystallin family protein [Eubacteriales bacterium]